MKKTKHRPATGKKRAAGGAVREITQPDVKRGAHGKWEKGASPNPGGRPKEDAELKAWARKMFDEKGRDAVLRIAEFAKDPRVMLSAWELVLDRGYGKSPTTATIKGDPDAPLEYVVNLVPWAWRVPDGEKEKP